MGISLLYWPIALLSDKIETYSHACAVKALHISPVADSVLTFTFGIPNVNGRILGTVEGNEALMDILQLELWKLLTRASAHVIIDEASRNLVFGHPTVDNYVLDYEG